MMFKHTHTQRTCTHLHICAFAFTHIHLNIHYNTSTRPGVNKCIDGVINNTIFTTHKERVIINWHSLHFEECIVHFQTKRMSAYNVPILQMQASLSFTGKLITPIFAPSRPFNRPSSASLSTHRSPLISMETSHEQARLTGCAQT